MTDDTNASLLDDLSAIIGRANVIVDPNDLAPFLEEPRKRLVSRARCAALPDSAKQVKAVVETCRKHSIPIVPQGGNTGLCGGSVSTTDGIIVNLKRMNRIRKLDAEAYTMEVESGCVLADLQAAALEQDRYFPLSLGAEGTCQIGGNLSTNAGGVNVLRYGNARDLALGLEVVLPDATIWTGLDALRKDNTGYDLKNLFIGAEGTLGIITAASLKLFPKPKHRSTAMLGLESVEKAVRLYARARGESSDFISSFELLSRTCVESALAHIPGCREPFGKPYPWYVLIELEDSTERGVAAGVSEAVLESAFEDSLIEDAVIASSSQQAKQMWHLRAAIVESQRHEGRSIKNDVSLPISEIAAFTQSASSAVCRHVPGIRCFVFGHIGDGNLHFNLCQPPDMDPDEFYARWEEITDLVNDHVLKLNGSFSAEHGIGLLKIRDMGSYKSPVELDLMRAIKTAIDPDDIMNPGKMLPEA